MWLTRLIVDDWNALTDAMYLKRAVEKLPTQGTYLTAIFLERGWYTKIHERTGFASSLAAALIALAGEGNNAE